MTRTLADSRSLSAIRRALGTRGRLLLLLPVALLVVLGASYLSRPPSVWIENRSSQQGVVFVTDGSSRPAAWYVVPARTTVHAGSDGLGSPDVTVNLLGWQHEAGHVGRCAPGNYNDTIYDVPRGAPVRLLIDETGRPSVSLAPEPPNPAPLLQAPLENLSEAGICAATGG
jgi:hypothetical protein